MNTSKVSVIILAYNQEDYIQYSINSVLEQEYENLEIVVNNDCSTDNTKAKIEELQKLQDGRIKLINAPYNQGINAGLTNAINLATGDYIVFLGGDDMLTPNYIKTVLEPFENNSDIDVVYCNLIPIDEKNVPYKNIPKKRYLTKNMSETEQLRFAFMNGNFVFSTGMIVKSNVVKQILPLPYSIVNNQDFKMHIDLLVNGAKNIVLDDKLILYRVFKDKTNISARGYITELRESLEFENVMNSFLGIKDIEFLKEIFKQEIAEFGIEPYPETIPYFLGRMAILSKKDAKKSWGYHQIVEFLKTQENFNLIKEKYNLEYKDLLKLASEFKNTTFQRCFKYKKLFNTFLFAFILSTSMLFLFLLIIGLG